MADQKHAPFSLGWGRHVLRVPPPLANPTPDELLTAFLDRLEQEGREDWQPNVAD